MTASMPESPTFAEPDGIARDVPLSWVTTAELVSGGMERDEVAPHGAFFRLRSFFLMTGLYIVLGFCIAMAVVRLLPQPWMEVVWPGSSPESPSIAENPLQAIPTSTDTRAHPVPIDTEANDDTAGRVEDGPLNAEKLQAEARNTAGDLGDVDSIPSSAEKQPQVQDEPTSLPVVEESAPVTTRKKVSPRVRRRVKKLTKKAKTYFKKKRYKSAKRLLQKAIALDPFYAPPYRHLGQTLRGLKDPKGARKAYKHYLELSPNSRYAPTMRKYLKN